MLKRVVDVQRSDDRHWVGDGFPVRTLFSYSTHGKEISPFLLLDYAAPTEFEPADVPRGVGQHPHRGFETVTIVYDGEVEHGDSAGNRGRIGPGDVQWMTAASGIVHEEWHGRDFTRRGGPFEMVQLWVNLPAKDKMSPPKYQEIRADQIPVVPLLDGAGSVRVIAGEWAGQRGPARTFTPINVWDVRVGAGRAAALAVAAGHNTILVLLAGQATVNDRQVEAPAIVLFDSAGEEIAIAADAETRCLLLSGRTIDEPVVGQGPFVMNTVGEMRQAIDDFRSGRMG